MQEASISQAAAKQPFYGATPTSSPKGERRKKRTKNHSTSTLSVTSLKEVCVMRGLIVIQAFCVLMLFALGSCVNVASLV